jgi:DNA-binding transcriptional MerR regulator
MNDTPHQPDNSDLEHSRLRLKRPPERRYYSIAEVAEETDLKPYVLRFWEKEFPTLRPKKNRAGNRTYQRKDIEMVLRIKHLLYDEGFTIQGARQRLRAEQSGAVPESDPLVVKRALSEIRSELEAIAALLA